MSFTLTAAGNELYQQLRDLREKIAEEEVVPVYYVFSNASLIDMTVRLPTDEDSFLKCERVGLKSFERYGEKFLDVIRQFISLDKGPTYTGEPEYKNNRHFLTADGRRLLELLKTARADIASAHHIDEQTLISDQTLINLIVLLPYSREEMIRIYGVRKDHREYYMDEFIRIIYSFTHGYKKRLYHVNAPKPRFSITREAAERFVYQPAMTATQIARELNKISDSSVHLSASDITDRVKKYDYYTNGFNRTILISDTGKKFGLLKENRISRNGDHYEIVLYDKDAQNKIVEWFIQ